VIKCQCYEQRFIYGKYFISFSSVICKDIYITFIGVCYLIKNKIFNIKVFLENSFNIIIYVFNILK